MTSLASRLPAYPNRDLQSTAHPQMADLTDKSPLLAKIESLKAQLESNYLRNEINEEKRRTIDIQEENHHLQKEHNERIYTLKNKIESGSSQLDKMKKDQEYSI